MVRLQGVSLLMIALTLGGSAIAQPPDPPDLPTGGGRQPRPGQQQQTKPRPFDEVVTKDFATQEGVFRVHRKAEKLLYEIPTAMLGREFLWITTLRGTPAGGYAGSAVGDLVLRWERKGDKVLLRQTRYGLRAEHDGAIRLAVEASNLAPIVQTFDIEALGEKEAPVIDVSRFYVSDPAEFSVANSLGGGQVDAARTFLEDVWAFSDNINVTTLMTVRGGGGGAGGVILSPFGGPQRGPSNTGLVHYSMCLLPEKPMMGRLFDSRVGYFSERFQDYGTDEHRVANRAFINRHRLEKKDPRAAISEPVKPIIYYVSREVPEKWRPYIKKGIEDWRPAFEAAGFKNAIVALDPPDDPKWSPEDSRYSVVRWAPTPTENAMGPNVHDPRSGEIISAHIIMWHNIMNLCTKWYFVQASPNDPRSQRLPLPDDLMGELVRYVAAHEVGHTLGLQHNFKASAAYTIAQLRSPEFTKKFGNESSIMDYGRFNYVAQPGDGAHLIPVVGPYDKFAIQWGYMPIAGARNPADEKRELDALAAKSATDPRLRFGANPNSGSDPTEQSEDLGDDGIEATRLGFKNLERVMGYLLPATTKFGEDYTDLAEMYGMVWSQYSTELGHLLPIVGGSVMTNTHAGRGGAVYKAVAKDRQRRAVALIGDICFRTPKSLLNEGVLNKIGPSFGASRLQGAQVRMINGLLSEARLGRMLEFEATMGAQAYTVHEMLADLRGSIFTELGARTVAIDPYRRTLQRSYVQALGAKMTGDGQASRDLAMSELRSLREAVRRAARSATDRATREHLAGLDRSITDALTPKPVVTVESTPATAPRGRGGLDDTCLRTGRSRCWGQGD